MTKLLTTLGPTTTTFALDGDLGVIGEPGDLLLIDQEKMTVDQRLGNYVYNVERAAAGTYAVPHSAGATVTAVGNANPAEALASYGLSGYLAETVPRQLCPEANTVIATTGQVFNQLIWIPAGTVVTNISFWSATTAAGTPTHYAFGLYSYSATAPALLGSTADQTSTAWAANTLLKLALTAPYTVTKSGLFYVAISVVATTVPTLKGMAGRTDGTLAGAAPIVAGINATAYTTGTLPATIGATTQGLNSVWCGLS